MALRKFVSNTGFTANQTSDTLITSMEDTPPAGGWLVIFGCHLSPSATTDNPVVTISIYKGGTRQDHTQRNLGIDPSVDAGFFPAWTHAWLDCSGSETVQIRARVDTTSATIGRRTMILVPAASGDILQATSSTGHAVSSGTDTLIGAMELTSVPAGPWLCLYSGSPSNDSQGIAGYRVHCVVYVNGSKTGTAHTERRQMAEESIEPGYQATPCAIACKVAPSNQTVDVRARRDGTLNWTIGPRTLTLLKVATADLLEASATSDASSTSTSYALLTGMQHVDPGANEWLALFTASQFLDASSASNDNISYSVFRSAGPTQETDSERTTTHEGSVDGADLYCNSHGTVTPASGTDDVELHWKSDTSVSRTCHERTLVLVREAQGGGSPLVVRRPRGVVAPWF